MHTNATMVAAREAREYKRTSSTNRDGSARRKVAARRLARRVLKAIDRDWQE